MSDRGVTVLPVVEEVMTVSSRIQRTGAVRVRVEGRDETQTVTADAVHDVVDIRHVPRGVQVQEPRAPWTEGDALVVPVYEEVLVTERRLMLREEIHLVRQTRREPVQQQVSLRSEQAVIERQQPDGQWQSIALPAGGSNRSTHAEPTSVERAARTENHPQSTEKESS